MINALRMPFSTVVPGIGPAGMAPHPSLDLAHAGKSVRATWLVDSGAAISVLPFRIGSSLGFDWDATPGAVQLVGGLARVQARPIVVEAVLGAFTPVRLAFAWCNPMLCLSFSGE